MTIKVTMIEKYKKGTQIKKDKLPRLRHLNENFIVDSTDVKCHGICTKDGVEMEFTDLRIYIRKSEITG